MTIVRNLLLAMLLLLPSLALAEFEDTELFAEGHGGVVLTRDTSDGQLWCSGATANTRGQELDITLYHNGNAALFIFDPNWSLSQRTIEFYLDIDYSRWEVEGSANDISVSVRLSDAEKTVQSLTQMMEGNAVAVYNSDGARCAPREAPAAEAEAVDGITVEFVTTYEAPPDPDARALADRRSDSEF